MNIAVERIKENGLWQYLIVSPDNRGQWKNLNSLADMDICVITKQQLASRFCLYFEHKTEKKKNITHFNTIYQCVTTPIVVVRSINSAVNAQLGDFDLLYKLWDRKNERPPAKTV